MSLPSQGRGSRGHANRGGMRGGGRHRRGRGPTLVVGFVVLAGVGWLLVWGVGSLDRVDGGVPLAGSVVDGELASKTSVGSLDEVADGVVDSAAGEISLGVMGSKKGGEPYTFNQGLAKSGMEKERKSEALGSLPLLMGGSAAPAPRERLAEGTGNPTHVGFTRLLDEADDAQRRGDLLAVRRILNGPLVAGRLDEAQASEARRRLMVVNEDLVFGPRVFAGDPLTETYVVKSGDSLARITARNELAVDWRLVQKVNGIGDPRRIRVGQSLKLVRGPFHAVVNKSAYRVDVYAGPPGERGSWTYVRSFACGLGEKDSTPVGEFRVRRDSKLVNPYWTNPRTGERFDANDPLNPIGERWIGIQGVGASAMLEGYGLHGTVDPDSIGEQRSMGCVRLRNDDIALVYSMLEEGVSGVFIEP